MVRLPQLAPGQGWQGGPGAASRRAQQQPSPSNSDKENQHAGRRNRRRGEKKAATNRGQDRLQERRHQLQEYGLSDISFAEPAHSQEGSESPERTGRREGKVNGRRRSRYGRSSSLPSFEPAADVRAEAIMRATSASEVAREQRSFTELARQLRGRGNFEEAWHRSQAGADEPVDPGLRCRSQPSLGRGAAGPGYDVAQGRGAASSLGHGDRRAQLLTMGLVAAPGPVRDRQAQQDADERRAEPAAGRQGADAEGAEGRGAESRRRRGSRGGASRGGAAAAETAAYLLPRRTR